MPKGVPNKQYTPSAGTGTNSPDGRTGRLYRRTPWTRQHWPTQEASERGTAAAKDAHLFGQQGHPLIGEVEADLDTAQSIAGTYTK